MNHHNANRGLLLCNRYFFFPKGWYSKFSCWGWKKQIHFLFLFFYRCKCPPNFHGPECQQTKHTFRGHGYAWFPPIKPCFDSRISLEFITEVADGLLLYNGPVANVQSGEMEDFIALG